MKFLTTSLTLAAVMASATLAAASESLVDKRSPAVAGHAEPMQRRKTCSSKKSHKKHSKHHHHKSSGKKSSSSGSSSGKTTDRVAESSSNNDSSSSSSSSSGSKTSGSGKDVKLNSKQGLAWPNAGGISIDKFLQSSISWYYSWGTRPGWNSAPTDIAFCPMLWGDSGSGGNLDDWKKDVIADPDNKWYSAKCMMGPNEVNQKGQSDMSVSDACSLMREHMMPLADKGWYFIGPSTTSAPNGLTQWYKQFQSECSDVFDRFDAISIHWYDVNINNFKEYVQNWHKQTGKDLWITEFACQNFNGGAQCSKQDAQEMMKEMSDWFLQQDYVKAFSPFGAMQNLQGVSEVNRLSNGNNPTSLFEIFANA